MAAADSPTVARQDDAHIDRDWVVRRRLIDGVKVREVRNIVTGNGITTELYRPTGTSSTAACSRRSTSPCAARRSAPGTSTSSAGITCSRSADTCESSLHDPREGSSTRDQVDVFHLSPARPSLLAIPPGVWHGVQNLSTDVSCFVNLFNRPYDYENPDEWRLPPDTAEIPYRFSA